VRIIVAGTIGRSVTGGQAWANMQYLVGLQELGHDVYYVEDCGSWSEVYDWDSEQIVHGLDLPARYIQACLEPIGFGNRWIYRTTTESRGIPLSEFNHQCRCSDLLIIRGVPMLEWRREYDMPARRAFIDVDPGFTQIRLAKSEAAYVETVARSETLFTVGHNVGSPQCPIPTVDRTWFHLPPPVSLSHWQVASDDSVTRFTSYMRWRGMKDVSFRGVTYGQKDREFPKFFDLPRRTSQPLRLAVVGAPTDKLREYGWEVVPGWTESRTPFDYQMSIQGSRAEFGVAKHCYVETQSGWFSDRSACFLASGRPVLVQDTGQAKWLPVGQGVLTFESMSDVLVGIERINEDYDAHRMAARKIAEEYFAADRVLGSLIEKTLSI